MTYEMPKPTAGDVVHTLAKAGISALPVIGTPIADFFALVFTQPIARRREEWFKALAARLTFLENKVAGFRIENLSSNEQFITAAMHATISAARTHETEKLEALRNAVINVALKKEADDDLQQIFLEYIDSLTPSHLRLLSFFADPELWFKKNPTAKPDPHQEPGIAYIAAHDTAFPRLCQSGVLHQLISDLRSRGLLDAPHLGHTDYGRVSYYATTLGKRLLEFITSPIE